MRFHDVWTTGFRTELNDLPMFSHALFGQIALWQINIFTHAVIVKIVNVDKFFLLSLTDDPGFKFSNRLKHLR